MSPSLVSVSLHGSVLVLTINNPPVNAFSHGVPEGLHAGLDRAEADPAITAAVLQGAGVPLLLGPTSRPLICPGSRPRTCGGSSAAWTAFPSRWWRPYTGPRWAAG
ncbi:enoyl-CoA hydratase/isomerase family protein [Deinococcus lacus]|uniref:Enoyl-CoA hydratase/isomerase family protein n=1 Tax=Deinococcus lacus TaxID=392561 RepID=A0ABW1YBJ9_9DEIO